MMLTKESTRMVWWWTICKSLTNWGRDKMADIFQMTRQNGWHFPDDMFKCIFLNENVWHFPDDMFKCIFLNENVWIPIEISLKFVPKGSINNNPSLFQIMAWCRPGDKPLSETMMVNLLTHICVTRPQWVNAEIRISTATLMVCHHGIGGGQMPRFRFANPSQYSWALINDSLISLNLTFLGMDLWSLFIIPPS